MKQNNQIQHIALIGCGYWGLKILRVLSNKLHPQQIIHVCEISTKILRLLSKEVPAVILHDDFNEILYDPKIDACIIATPSPTHYKLAKKALLSGKHVFVEKPMTLTVKESDALVQLAQKMQRVLMVDHTYVYDSSIHYVRELVKKKNFGKPLSYISTRISNGIIREKENVVWDMGIHDIVITRYIFETNPLYIAVQGSSTLPSGIVDTAQIMLMYPNGIHAYSTVSWSSPTKVRKIHIAGTKQTITLETKSLTQSSVRIFETQHMQSKEIFRKVLVQKKQSLTLCLKEFIGSIEKGNKPCTDGQDGAIVTRILEAADKSYRNKGIITKIQYK